MSILFDKIEDVYKKESPFVAYRKPNSDVVQGFFQKNNKLFFTEKLTESGFVFAPFDSKNDAILIPEKEAEHLQEKVTSFASLEDEKSIVLESNAENNFSKNAHIELVEKAIESIDKNEFKKVVVSRKETLEFVKFDLLTIYKRLLDNYPNAFVYVWFHPEVGLWFGASPETLLNMVDNQFSTMSLAGTQVYKDIEEITWKSKELEEQQLVTDFIENQLKPIVTSLEIGERTTVKAGNLLHLKTKASGMLAAENATLKCLVKALHPTPAVCGLPREATKKFIQENETYQRSYYTGYLGELNLEGIQNKKTSTLFVNLRCMEIENNTANLFIGGGITKESNPEKEWEETVAKSSVMRKVL